MAKTAAMVSSDHWRANRLGKPGKLHPGQGGDRRDHRRVQQRAAALGSVVLTARGL